MTKPNGPRPIPPMAVAHQYRLHIADAITGQVAHLLPIACTAVIEQFDTCDEHDWYVAGVLFQCQWPRSEEPGFSVLDVQMRDDHPLHDLVIADVLGTRNNEINQLWPKHKAAIAAEPEPDVYTLPAAVGAAE